jgi:hypothetical protein
MTPIKADCRDRLNAEDFRFLTRTLDLLPSGNVGLAALFTEDDARRAALGDDRLWRALLESPDLLSVSPRLYFYVLTRRALAGFDDEVADYIASVLATFLETRRVRKLPEQPEANAEYLSDMLTALAAVTADRAFMIQAHIGNYALFVSGIFPGRIARQEERHGAPGLGFYEKVGRTHYRLAAEHRLAQRHSLSEIYRTIADHFPEVRHDLNQLADRLICLEPAGNPP